MTDIRDLITFEDYPYINKFHREKTEKCLKAIAEMKKTPMNYEEEYERHKAMNKRAREAEMEELQKKD